ncbi:hypothetical protein Tco_1089196, partial [Tanacetum coccineum]
MISPVFNRIRRFCKAGRSSGRAFGKRKQPITVRAGVKGTEHGDGRRKHVTPSSRSSRSGDHRRSRIGVKVGWFQGDILTLGIIETVQNHHLVTKETTEIMKIKEADMKVQGELLMELSQNRSLAVWISSIISAVVLIFLLSL